VILHASTETTTCCSRTRKGLITNAGHVLMGQLAARLRAISGTDLGVNAGLVVR